MTTIVNPSGNTTISYSRSGLTIDSLTGGGNGSNTATATPIIRYATHTVIRATTATGSAGFLLPTDAEIGDVVEVLGENASTATVMTPSGFSLNNLSGGKITARRVVLRLVDTTNWNVITSGTDLV